MKGVHVTEVTESTGSIKRFISQGFASNGEYFFVMFFGGFIVVLVACETTQFVERSICCGVLIPQNLTLNRECFFIQFLGCRIILLVAGQIPQDAKRFGT